MSFLEALCVFVCVGRGVKWGVVFGWGLAAPAQPSATKLWPRVTCLVVCSLHTTRHVTQSTSDSPSIRPLHLSYGLATCVRCFVRPLVRPFVGLSIRLSAGPCWSSEKVWNRTFPSLPTLLGLVDFIGFVSGLVYLWGVLVSNGYDFVFWLTTQDLTLSVAHCPNAKRQTI